jgi:hypothetical protein
MITRTYAVFVIAQNLIGRRVLESGITLIYATSESEAMSEATKAAAEIFPLDQGWGNHGVVVKDITLRDQPEKFRHGYFLHLYGLFASRKDGETEQVKLGIDHNLSASPVADKEASYLARLHNMFPARDGWRNHFVGSWSKEMRVILETEWQSPAD